MVYSGLFLSGLSNFLVGPSTLLPNSLILITFGLYILGITMVFANLPPLPIMLKQVELVYPYQKSKASDLCSTIYYLMFSLGQFLSPIYSGYMTYLIGYRTCCDTVGLLLVLYSIVYYML